MKIQALESPTINVEATIKADSTRIFKYYQVPESCQISARECYRQSAASHPMVHLQHQPKLLREDSD